MIINVKYHLDPDGVWAESADLIGLAVTAQTLEEARDLVREGLPIYLDIPAEDVDIRELVEAANPTGVTVHLESGQDLMQAASSAGGAPLFGYRMAAAGAAPNGAGNRSAGNRDEELVG